MPTPPPADVIALHDYTPDEIESSAELALHLNANTLAGKVVEGLDLRGPSSARLSTVDVNDTLFVGCHFDDVDTMVDLLRRGAVVVPAFASRPYPTHPSRLYTPEDLTIRGQAEIIIAKHRQGETGSVSLTWRGATTSFHNPATLPPAGPDPF